jgi:ABC-type Mn2+/Zn2+ transport system ATPase subunit
MSLSIQTNQLTKSYGRSRGIIDVTFGIQEGEVFGFLGPNGAGKTTFFKALVGLVPKESGAVIFGGHGKVGADTNIAYLPQRSVIDRDFPGIWRRFGKADPLRTIGLVDLAERQISALSGGQQQRAFLARSLAQNAHVFLLDEPFTALDAEAAALVDRELAERRDRATFVVATHDPARVEPFASARLELAA